MSRRSCRPKTVPPVNEKDPAQDEPVSPFEIAADEDLSNLRKWEQAQANVSIERFRNIDKHQFNPKNLQNLSMFLKRPVHDNRKCYIASVQHKRTQGGKKAGKMAWYYVVKSRPPVASIERSGVYFICYDYRWTKSQADKVMEVVVRIMDRLPVPIVGNQLVNKVLRYGLLNVASELALPNLPLQRHAVTWEKKTSFWVAVDFFDIATLEPVYHRFQLKRLNKDPDQIPPTPRSIRWEVSNQRKSVRPFPNPTTEAERREQQSAIKYLQYLAWKLQNLVTTKTGLKAMALEWENSIGIFRARRAQNALAFGWYGDKQMFYVTIGKGQRRILTATKAVLQDVKGTFTPITLHKPGKREFIRLTTAMLSRWMSTGNVKEVWTTGCALADMINRSDDLEDVFQTECDCTSDSSATTLHLCHGCALSTLCSELGTTQERQRLCAACTEHFKLMFRSEAEKAEFSFAVLSPTEVHLHHRLMELLVKDANCRKKGRAESMTATRAGLDIELVRSSWDTIASYVKNSKNAVWRDAYNPKLRSHDPFAASSGHGPSINPFDLTIDAVYPYSSWKGAFLSHTPDNMVVTVWYINALKNVFPPAILNLVCEYLHSKQGTEEREELIKRMDVIHELGLKTPYTKAERFSHKYDESKLRRDRREWAEAILLPSKNQPWAGRYHVYTVDYHLDNHGTAASSVDWGWKPPGEQRILGLIKDIEKKFGGRLKRRNGCPYPFDPSAMPEDWCWKRCFHLFVERLRRMTYECNRYWETVDCEETLYLECVWQYLDPSYEDLFNLPMVTYVRHPLRFAVAKVIHGKQMRTRWLNHHPVSVDERDDELNNISIETCLTNWAKFRAPNEMYPKIKADFMSVSVSSMWHQRSPREGTRVSDTEIDTAEFFPLRPFEDLTEGLDSLIALNYQNEGNGTSSLV